MLSLGIRHSGIDFRGSASDAMVYGWWDGAGCRFTTSKGGTGLGRGGGGKLTSGTIDGAYGNTS